MTKIEHARQLMTKNPKISPADMSAEMGLPIKQVYLLRSQAKASLKKVKKKSLVSSINACITQHNAQAQAWDDEPSEGPANWKLTKEPQPQFGLPDKNNPVTPLLAKMDRLREELADARAVIKYLEKKLYEKAAGNGPGH
jgi:hypothetical protein